MLSLPADAAAPVDIRVGRLEYHIEPGARTTLRYKVDEAGPWQLRFESAGGSIQSDVRPVSVQMTKPRFDRAGTPSRPALQVTA
jgi:hypothetical protein